MDEKESNTEQSKADQIREKFKKKSNAESDSKVDFLLEKAKERAKMYTEEGQNRAIQNTSDKEKVDQAKTIYRQTTIRILLNDLGRLKKQEMRFLSENDSLTYDKVFLLGLDCFEKMSDSEIREYIEKNKKR